MKLPFGIRQWIARLVLVSQLVAWAPLGAPGQDRVEYDPVDGLSRHSPDMGSGTGTVDVFSRLNVREGPGLQFGIIGKLYPGEQLKILSTENGWHKLDWHGREAYVCAYWVHTKGEQWNNPSLGDGGGDSSGGGGNGGGGNGGGNNGGSGGSNQRPQAGGPLLSMPLINQNTGGGSHPSGYCGPTSVRMVLAYYGIQAGADEVALRNYGAGPMYTPGQGSQHAGIRAALQHYGLNAELHYTHNVSELRAAIAKGHPVIVGVHGNYGPFYTDGHIIVVVGFDGAGNPIINDSAGGVRRTLNLRTFMNCWQGLFVESWK